MCTCYLLCVVDKVEADRLKEMTELLSGLSSFVKVDKLTKVRDSGRGRSVIDCM